MMTTKSLVCVGTCGNVTKTFLLPKGTEIGEVTQVGEEFHFTALVGHFRDLAICVATTKPV